MELYLFLMLFFIPCFWYGAANGSHDFMSILFSAVMWAYWLFTGFPFDPLIMGIITYFILSVSWSKHIGNSINDLLMILALITVIFVSQSVDKFLIMLFSFIPAVGMAGLEIYQWYKKQEPARRGALFGNTNHSGIYFAINFFIGLWISYNISLIFLPFCVLLLLALMATRCRAAILSLCVGMGIVLFREVGVWVIPIGLIIGIIAVINQRPFTFKEGEHSNHLLMSYQSRGNIFLKTIMMIIEKPVWGWGLGTFRKEQQERLPPIATHRVHNDILEIAYEVGLVGLLLITYFFYTLSWSDPFISAAIVAGIVSSCFFFTFRESHTAAPLMALCGLSLPPIETVAVPYIISGVVVLAMLNILWNHVIKKIVALTYYGIGSFKKDKESQAKYVEKAVMWFPSTEYLSRHAFYLQFKDIGECYNVASKMVYNYDGRIVLWEGLDQLARACYRMGAVNLADYFNHRALGVNPNFPKGLEFRKNIEKLFQELKESKHGTVAVR